MDRVRNQLLGICFLILLCLGIAPGHAFACTCHCDAETGICTPGPGCAPDGCVGNQPGSPTATPTANPTQTPSATPPPANCTGPLEVPIADVLAQFNITPERVAAIARGEEAAPAGFPAGVDVCTPTAAGGDNYLLGLIAPPSTPGSSAIPIGAFFCWACIYQDRNPTCASRGDKTECQKDEPRDSNGKLIDPRICEWKDGKCDSWFARDCQRQCLALQVFDPTIKCNIFRRGEISTDGLQCRLENCPYRTVVYNQHGNGCAAWLDIIKAHITSCGQECNQQKIVLTIRRDSCAEGHIDGELLRILEIIRRLLAQNPCVSIELRVEACQSTTQGYDYNDGNIQFKFCDGQCTVNLPSCANVASTCTQGALPIWCADGASHTNKCMVCGGPCQTPNTCPRIPGPASACGQPDMTNVPACFSPGDPPGCNTCAAASCDCSMAKLDRNRAGCGDIPIVLGGATVQRNYPVCSEAAAQEIMSMEEASIAEACNAACQAAGERVNNSLVPPRYCWGPGDTGLWGTWSGGTFAACS